MKLCIDCGISEAKHTDLDHTYHYEPDNCQVCKGEKGGLLGNENIIKGIIVCDYCHVDYMDGKIDLEKF